MVKRSIRTGKAPRITLRDIFVQIQSMKEDIASIGKRMDRMEQRFDGLEKRMDRMEVHFDGMGKRIDGMGKHMDGMDQRIGGLEQYMKGMEKRLTTAIRANTDGIALNTGAIAENSRAIAENGKDIFLIHRRIDIFETNVTQRFDALDEDLTATIKDTLMIRRHVGIPVPDEE